MHHQKALADGADVAEISARQDHPVRHFPVELLDDLDGNGFLPFDAQTVHRVGQINMLVLGHFLHRRHAAVEIGIQGQHQRAVGERLHQLRRRYFIARQKYDGRNARRRAVGRQCRRSIAGRSAGHRIDGLAVGDHLIDHRHQDGHAEILERAGVRVAALLDPEILDVKLLAVAIGPEEIGVALAGRNDVLVVDKRDDPLLLRPHARAVGVGILAQAIVEELDPRRCGPGLEGLGVVVHFEQIAARRAAVDNLQQADTALDSP